jgi:hypothetical protein
MPLHTPVIYTMRRFRSIPTGSALPAYDGTQPRHERFLPGIPTIAVLGARHDADVAGLLLSLAKAITAHEGAPALLWTDRTDTLEEGVVTVASGETLMPDALRKIVVEFRTARIAHLGYHAERKAAEALFDDLEGITHALVDGRILGAVKATLGVFVVGDGIGDDSPLVRSLRDVCDVEVNEPGAAVAEAILRAVARRS